MTAAATATVPCRVPTALTIDTPPTGCFVVFIDHAVDRGEGLPHFPTWTEARVHHQEFHGPAGPPAKDRIFRLLLPCVELTCQCGAYALGEDDDESPGVLHFSELADAAEYAAGAGMTVGGPAGREYLLFDAETSWLRRDRHRFDCASVASNPADDLTNAPSPSCPVSRGETS